MAPGDEPPPYGDVALEELLREWDGEDVVIRHDAPTGAWIVIALHSTVPGPATGGTRLAVYPDLEAAAADALALAGTMTLKFAVARFPRGGGKAVIAVPPGLTGESRVGLLRRYGSLLRQLGGLFQAGPDMGVTPADMDTIAETGAPHVFTTSAAGAGDSGPPTALGVCAAIEEAAAFLFGTRHLDGRTVLVQGVGSVGSRLVRLLHDRGARVLVSDRNERVAEALAHNLGLEVIPAGDVYTTPCDVLSPCAVGGVLTAATIPLLACRAVAGSANNQLGQPEDAELLRRRDILYAPDFVCGLGGAVAITGMEALRWTREEAEERVVQAVAEALQRIFPVARDEGITTLAAARRLALAYLDEKTGSTPGSHPTRAQTR